MVAHTGSGGELSAQTSFQTLKRRVRVSLETINITETGQLIGDGHPRWGLAVVWPWAGGTWPWSGLPGRSKACYPDCTGAVAGHSTGTFHPFTADGSQMGWLFEEENFYIWPALVRVGNLWAENTSASTCNSTTSWYDLLGQLSDWYVVLGGTCGEPPVCGPHTFDWPAPAGVESASVQASTCSSSVHRWGTFKSELTWRFDLFHDDKVSSALFPNVPKSIWDNGDGGWPACTWALTLDADYPIQILRWHTNTAPMSKIGVVRCLPEVR